MISNGFKKWIMATEGREEDPLPPAPEYLVADDNGVTYSSTITSRYTQFVPTYDWISSGSTVSQS